jgi:hypothetical protein
MSSRAFLLVAALGLPSIAGCQNDGHGQDGVARKSNRENEPMPGVEVAVTGHRVVFDGKATEVLLQLKNTRREPVSLSGLSDKASLVLGDGSALGLHAISVGVQKPLRLAPGKSQPASILFAGRGEAPSKLRLLDAEVAVPR